jgi:TetR/AcrR family transcriptional repressor of nem operon
MASRVREKIVNAAVERFHALGFNACGVQEIVDKAGVPKGSFYNYFKAKELLALEVLEIYVKGSGRDILADTRVPPVQRLRAHFEFMASQHKSFGYDRGCLIGNLAAETSDSMPLIRQAIAQSLTEWTALLAVPIHEGQSNGSILPSLDAEQLARFLINSWLGALVRMKVANSREPLDDFFSVAFPLLEQTTLAKPAAGTASTKSKSSRSSGAKPKVRAAPGR